MRARLIAYVLLTLARRALELDPANRQAQYVLIKALVYLKRYREAIAEGAALFSKFGEDPATDAWLARAYHAEGDYVSAEIHFARAPGVDPIGYGMLLQDMGRTEEAIQKWRDVERLNLATLDAYPQDVRAHERLAMVYGCLGERENLERHAEFVLREEPGNGYYLSHIADAYAASGDGTRAVDYYQRSLDAGSYIFPPATSSWPGRRTVEDALAYQQYVTSYEEILARLRTSY